MGALPVSGHRECNAGKELEMQPRELSAHSSARNEGSSGAPQVRKMELVCSHCGYGAVCHEPPDRCPMCGTRAAWAESPRRSPRRLVA
jgi:rubrerythrin